MPIGDAKVGVWGRLEEARKSWEHVVSDEVVYVCESTLPNFKRLPGAIDWLTKYKLGRLWVELHFVLQGQRNGYFNAIVEFAGNKRGNGFRLDDSEAQGSRIDRHHNVLVEVAKVVQLPQGVILKGCPSVVRLQLFDDHNRYAAHRFDRPVKLRPTLPTADAKNGEGRVSGWLGTIEQRELPRQLIQTGPKAVSELANEQRDGLRHGTHLKPDDVAGVLNIVLFYDGTVFTSPVSHKFRVESIEVLFRPAGFHIRIG